MQQRVIFRPCHAAAARSDDQPGALAQLRQHRRLPLPEAILTLKPKNLRDIHPGLLLEYGVRVQERAAQLRGQPRADRRLAAARHTDENHVLHLRGQQFCDRGNAFVCDRCAEERLAAFLCLRGKHQKPVCPLEAELLRLQQKFRARRIVDHVQRGLQRREPA